MKLAACSDADSRRNTVPAAKLIERDTESIGDGYERIAATRGVERGMSSARDNRSQRHNHAVNTCKALGLAQLIGFSKFALAYAVAVCNAGERVLRGYAMIAPRGTMHLWNERDALLEEFRCAGRKV